jgi:glycosyltransferase involved in cell wall biosynthesis
VSGAAPLTVVSVHGPHALSGVTTWAGRMAGLDGPLRHRMLVVRRRSDPPVDAGFPGWGTPGFRVITLDDSASVSDEVLAIAEELRGAVPAVALVHDHVPAAISAAMLDRDDLALASISHADEPRYAALFERLGPLLDCWWGDSEAARARAENADCADACAGAFPGGAPRVADGALPPRRFGPSSPARLLWLGRVERYQKRVFDALMVMERLVGCGTPATLTIAGDGPALRDVHAYIERRGLGGVCRAVGAVAPPDIPLLLSSHDALLMTSAFEGTPVAASEAAHRGLGLFVTDGCGGLLDLAEPGELVVTPSGDPDAQARAIDAAVLGDGRLTEMGRSARGFARRALDQSVIRRSMDEALRAGHERRMAAPRREHDPVARWASILGLLDMLDGVTQSDVIRIRDVFGLDREGRGLAGSLPTCLPRLPRLNERLILEAVGHLREQGVDRVALYGAGHHTSSASRMIRDMPEISLVIDDEAGDGETIGGVPVVRPGDDRVRAIRAVIVSSSEYEDELAGRASGWAGDRPVIRLYRPTPSAGSLSTVSRAGSDA